MFVAPDNHSFLKFKLMNTSRFVITDFPCFWKFLKCENSYVFEFYLYILFRIRLEFQFFFFTFCVFTSKMKLW